MFLVGYPQTSEPVIPLVDWHKLTVLVLTCHETPISQFTAITSHGSVPRVFVTITVIPIPKKRNCDMSDSENFRGISLNSLFGKSFDNVIMNKFHENLCTSDLGLNKIAQPTCAL